MNFKNFLFTALFVTGFGLRVTVLSDLHYDPAYLMNMDYEKMCHTTNDALIEPYSEGFIDVINKLNEGLDSSMTEKLKYGSYGCDSP